MEKDGGSKVNTYLAACVVKLLGRETTAARYIRPAIISRLATERACDETVTTPPMPVLDSSAKLRWFSSDHIELHLVFKSPVGLDAAEITIEVEFEQDSRMVSRSRNPAK